MNINIGYAVILRFHDFHLGGQTKLAYLLSESPDRYFKTLQNFA